MRALAMLAVWMAIPACTSCTHTPPSPFPPPVYSDATTPTMLPPATVYDELLEAGCVAPDPDGGEGNGLVNVVELEYADVEANWVACLFAGGTPKGCNAPCP